MWYQIGKDSDDPLMRFFSYYLCLNILMAKLSEEELDSKMKDWVKRNRSILNDAYQSALRDDSFQAAIHKLIGECPVKRMRRRRQQQSEESTMANLNDFGGLVDVLYRIRCNLFHGEKDSMNPRDVKLVELAASILDDWMGKASELIR